MLNLEGAASLDELDRLATAFVRLGVTKLRITGGDPLLRKHVMDLIARQGRHLERGLDELSLTTNGTQLARHAQALRAAGVRRMNVSLKSLEPEVFGRLTRGGDLALVLASKRPAPPAWRPRSTSSP